MLACRQCYYVFPVSYQSLESNLDYWRREYTSRGQAGVSYEYIPSLLLLLLQLYHFVSFLSCINQTVSYPSLFHIWQKLESLTLPCRAERITCTSVFPAHFFCCSYNGVPFFDFHPIWNLEHKVGVENGLLHSKLYPWILCYWKILSKRWGRLHLNSQQTAAVSSKHEAHTSFHGAPGIRSVECVH